MTARLRSALSAALLLAAGIASASAQERSAVRMQVLAAGCSACHGADGTAGNGIPVLAGQTREELARKMREFAAGTRPSTVMGQIARGYTEAQIEALATYFAARKAAQ